jgi:hypothetical protein
MEVWKDGYEFRILGAEMAEVNQKQLWLEKQKKELTKKAGKKGKAGGASAPGAGAADGGDDGMEGGGSSGSSMPGVVSGAGATAAVAAAGVGGVGVGAGVGVSVGGSGAVPGGGSASNTGAPGMSVADAAECERAMALETIKVQLLEVKRQKDALATRKATLDSEKAVLMLEVKKMRDEDGARPCLRSAHCVPVSPAAVCV